MRPRPSAIAGAALALLACSHAAEQNASSKADSPAQAVTNTPAIPPPATGPDARTPLAEPETAIDPKSAEAAGQVVQHYGALIEQKRWTEANTLWANRADAVKFTTRLVPYAEVHLEMGNLSVPEGAAGSIYMTEPVVFSGDIEDGEPFHRPAVVTLRRVNDVPGSTEEQRHWHIEKIEWSAPS